MRQQWSYVFLALTHRYILKLKAFWQLWVMVGTVIICPDNELMPNVNEKKCWKIWWCGWGRWVSGCAFRHIASRCVVCAIRRGQPGCGNEMSTYHHIAVNYKHVIISWDVTHAVYRQSSIYISAQPCVADYMRQQTSLLWLLLAHLLPP